MNVAHVKRILRQYVGASLEMLGEIPEDPAIARSVRTYLPVVESAPTSPAALAFARVAEELTRILARDSAAANGDEHPCVELSEPPMPGAHFQPVEATSGDQRVVPPSP